MEKEEWRDVPGYEGYYQVSNMGQVKSFHIREGKQERILKFCLVGCGYLAVSLCKSGSQKRKYIHALVLSAFTGERPEKSTCNHINGNKHDNCLKNLEYCTQAENNLHSFRVLKRLPVINRGEKSGISKLTNDNVRSIRDLYSSGKYTMKDLEKIFNVSDSTILNIIHRKTWGHVA